MWGIHRDTHIHSNTQHTLDMLYRIQINTMNSTFILSHSYFFLDSTQYMQIHNTGEHIHNTHKTIVFAEKNDNLQLA